MKQILIATHGKMASGIRYTAELIIGKMAEITTIDAYVNSEDNVEKQIDDYFCAHSLERIFVFTDIIGGSVNQKIMGYADKHNIILITGMNLSVLIEILLAEDEVSESEIREYIDAAREELQLVTLQKEIEKEVVVKPLNTQRASDTVNEQNVNYENSSAKITALRVDDRLIHGQVAMTWTKQLRVQGILVANDAAAKDSTQKMALKMAVPAGIKVLVETVDEAIRLLNYSKASQMRILILTRTIRDALTVRENVGEVEFLNIGNVGRFDGRDGSEKKVLTSTIMLTNDEIDCLEKLVKIAPNTCIQQVPNDEQKLVRDVIKKLK